MKVYRSYFLVVGVVLLLGLVLAGSVSAQDDSSAGVASYDAEITGIVDEITDTSITVDGIVIPFGPDLLIGEIQLQSRVQVRLIMMEDGTYVAAQIRLHEQDRDGQDDDSSDDSVDDSPDDSADDSVDDSTEIVGTIEMITGDTILVAGMTFDISGAEIETQLQEGMLVKLHLRDRLQDGSGMLVVDEVDDANDADLMDDDSGDDSNDDEYDDDIDENCQAEMPDGWLSYQVQAGDTVSGLAVRTNSEVRELVRTNCLHDAGHIVVGDELFVPTEPVPAQYGQSSDDSGEYYGEDHSDDDHGEHYGDDHSNDDSNYGDDHSDDDHGESYSDDHSDDDHGERHSSDDSSNHDSSDDHDDHSDDSSDDD